MKTINNLIIAAMVLITIACSNDENDFTQLPIEKTINNEIIITATLNTKDNAITRAIADEGSIITSNLAVGEEIAVLFNDGNSNLKRLAIVKSVDAGKVTIQFTIPTTLATNTACTLVYPATAINTFNNNVDSYANLFAKQDGSLGTNLDVRKGTATILNDGTTASLIGATTLAAQNSIFKLTLKNINASSDISATKVIIHNQSGKLTTITPAPGCDKVMYIALPTTSTELYFDVTGSDSKKYFNMAMGLSLSSNMYYQSIVKLATVGDYLGANGKFYATKDDATSASTTAEAVIAYVGTETFYFNYFIAIALNDAGSSVNWSNALTAVRTYANTHPITIGDVIIDGTNVLNSAYDKIASNSLIYSGGSTILLNGWRMPNVIDWRYIFAGLCDGPSATSPQGIVNMETYGNGSTLCAVINTKCGNTDLKEQNYWSSSENKDNSTQAVYYRFDDSNFTFDNKTVENNMNARAVFAY